MNGNGPQPPDPADVEQLLKMARASREAKRLLDAEDRQPIRLVPASEVRKREPPPFLVDGLIPAGPSIGVFFGETGTYKSFLVLNLLLCAGALSAAFLGHMVNGTGWGIYVMGEGQYDAGLRLDAAVTAHPGFTDEHLAYIEQPFPLSDEDAVDEVIARCRELAQESGLPVLLVVFDSFADFYGAGDSENSSTDMQRLIAGMKRIAAELGCVVMANAHTGHGGKDEDGEDKPPPTRLRGSSRFRQAWDFELMATGLTLVPTKNRYGPLADAMPYKMDAAGGSLVLSAEPGLAAGARTADDPPFPYPCPPASFSKVVKALSRTPGMTQAAICDAAKVRRAHVQIALLMGEAIGLLANTGTKSRPAWARSGPLADWLDAVSSGRDWPPQTAAQQQGFREHRQAHAEWLASGRGAIPKQSFDEYLRGSGSS